jgi:valyl-tRNA synthetase
MKLLHPFMPFISEEIYQSLADTERINNDIQLAVADASNIIWNMLRIWM